MQDVLKEPAEYWGIPSWLGAKLTPAQHAYPWPMADTEGFTTWACGYFSQEISNAFHQAETGIINKTLILHKNDEHLKRKVKRY